MLDFECKKCRIVISAETIYIGDVVKCPSCGSAEIVPDTPFPVNCEYCGYVIQGIFESDLLWTAYRAIKADDSSRTPVLLKVPSQFFLKHVSDLDAFIDAVIRNGTLNLPEFPKLIDRSVVKSRIFFAFDYIPTTHGLRFFTKIDLPDVLELIRGIAVALRDTWDKNLIIHQNLTPQNIRITKDQKVRIHNIGISRPLLSDRALLDWGFHIWDFRYMSPEFIQQGIADTPGCDIYSLGGLLFYLLTGHHPYERVNPADITRIPVPNPTDFNKDIPPALLSLFNVMMAKDMDDRLKTWGGVIENLNSILGLNQKSGNQTQFVDRYEKSDTATHPKQKEHFASGVPQKKVFHKHKKQPKKKSKKHLVFNTDTTVMKLNKVHSKWRDRH